MNPEEFNAGVSGSTLTVQRKEVIVQPVPSQRRLLTVTRKRFSEATGKEIDPETVEIDLDREINVLENLSKNKAQLTIQISVHKKYVDELTAVYNEVAAATE